MCPPPGGPLGSLAFCPCNTGLRRPREPRFQGGGGGWRRKSLPLTFGSKTPALCQRLGVNYVTRSHSSLRHTDMHPSLTLVSPPRHAPSISFPFPRPHPHPHPDLGVSLDSVSPGLHSAPPIQSPAASRCPGDDTPSLPGPPVGQAGPHLPLTLCHPRPRLEASWTSSTCSHVRPLHRLPHAQAVPRVSNAFPSALCLFTPAQRLPSQVPSCSVSEVTRLEGAGAGGHTQAHPGLPRPQP